MEGLDDIGLTLEKAEAIDAYEERSRLERPWA
jgi:3-isopropylmalate/(R)-2-methylmalate dehydratase small subunit